MFTMCSVSDHPAHIYHAFSASSQETRITEGATAGCIREPTGLSGHGSIGFISPGQWVWASHTRHLPARYRAGVRAGLLQFALHNCGNPCV